MRSRRAGATVVALALRLQSPPSRAVPAAGPTVVGGRHLRWRGRLSSRSTEALARCVRVLTRCRGHRALQRRISWTRCPSMATHVAFTAYAPPVRGPRTRWNRLPRLQPSASGLKESVPRRNRPSQSPSPSDRPIVCRRLLPFGHGDAVGVVGHFAGPKG